MNVHFWSTSYWVTKSTMIHLTRRSRRTKLPRTLSQYWDQSLALRIASSIQLSGRSSVPPKSKFHPEPRTLSGLPYVRTMSTSSNQFSSATLTLGRPKLLKSRRRWKFKLMKSRSPKSLELTLWTWSVKFWMSLHPSFKNKNNAITLTLFPKRWVFLTVKNPDLKIHKSVTCNYR